MPDIVLEYAAEIRLAIGQTFVMVGVSILAAILLGLPLGTWLFCHVKDQLLSNRSSFSTLNLLVNTIRSFPFLLLVVFLIPFTRSHHRDGDRNGGGDCTACGHCHRPLFTARRTVVA